MPPVILIGRYFSPYTRRVAVTMRLLGIPYEHQVIRVYDQMAEMQRFNPLARVPTLVLDDGECLIESGAILDHLDELAGPAKALTPPRGAERRRVLRAAALATGALDKGIQHMQEAGRPAAARKTDMMARNQAQVRAAFAALEAMAGGPYLAGDRLTQADVTTVVAWDFLKKVTPELLPPGTYRGVEALVGRLSKLPAFAETPPD
jgi:glutathione S-transferase